MTLNDLTVDFAHLNRAQLLSDWNWLIGEGKLPILLSAAGDAFVQDSNDGSVHFLDVVSGRLSRVAASGEEFRTLLRDEAFVRNHFSVRMVSELIQSGSRLTRGKIYSFKTPPALGGKFDLNNLETVDIEVHFSIAGQIHKQCKDLPDGTPIRAVELIGGSKRRKWWQFWG